MESSNEGSAPDGAYQLGECHGGPWNGQTAMSRFPKGFLLVGKQAGQAWIYDWNGDAFVCRESEGRPLDYDQRLEAADGQEWDVIAFAGGDAK